MKLMILSDSPVHRTGELYFGVDKWLKVPGYLEPYFSDILLCVPLQKEGHSTRAVPVNETWRGKRIRWTHTFPHRTVMHYYKLLPLVLVRNLPVLWAAVRESDVVFIRVPSQNGYFASLMARLLGKRAVCYFSGDQRMLIFQGGKYRGFWSWPARAVALFHDRLFRKMVRRAVASIFEGENTMSRFVDANGNCTFMFPSTIEQRQIWMRPPARTEGHHFNLLFVGGLEKAKGINYLLHAMAQLRQAGINCTLSICGDGPERQALEELVARLGLAEVVRFLGHVRESEELDHIYRSNDILVHPSLSEGVPKVVFEAMANGLAIIATTVGGIPGIVSQDENGLLVPPKSSEAIFHAVVKVVRDHTLRNRLVEGGYAFIRAHTAEKQAQRLASILLSAGTQAYPLIADEGDEQCASIQRDPRHVSQRHEKEMVA